MVYERFFTARQSGRLFFLLPTPNWIVFVQKHQLDLERGQPFIIPDFSKQKKTQLTFTVNGSVHKLQLKVKFFFHCLSLCE